MEKQVIDEEEIVLDKAEFLKNKNKVQSLKYIEADNVDDLMVEEKNIERDSEGLKLVDMIDWTKVKVIEEHEQYNIEEVPIKDQIKKIMTVIRVKKLDKGKYASHLFAETKNNYLLIKENYQKFYNVPIIFDVREIDGKELIVVIQHYKNDLNLFTKYQSIEYTKWQYDNTQDLLQFLKLGITFDSGSLKDPAFVQTRMNYFLFNPKIFISRRKSKMRSSDYQRNKEDTIELEEEDQIDEPQYKSKQRQSKSKQQESEGNEIVQNIIIKSILSCLSNILERNIFEVDLNAKNSQNIERLIMSLIEEVIAKEKEEYIKLVMQDLQNNQRWYIKKKKKRRGSSSRKRNTKKNEDQNVKLLEQWEQLKRETEQRTRDNFYSQKQHLYDLIVSIYESCNDLSAVNSLLKEFYQIEKNLKKKCMISLSDERNVKKLASILSKNSNKQTIKNQKEQESAQSKLNKSIDEDEEETVKNGSNTKKVKKPIRKKDIRADSPQSPINENKRIKLNDTKRKMPIPKKTGILFRNGRLFNYAKQKQLHHNISKQNGHEEKENRFMNNLKSYHYEKDEEIQIFENKFHAHTVKFAFSIYGECKEVAQLYKTLRSYKNNFTSITLLFSSMKLSSGILKKYIIPMCSFPNLLYMRLHLNGCFQSNPIFWDLQDLEVEKRGQDEDDDDEEEETTNEECELNVKDKIKDAEDNTNNKENKVQDIINEIVEKGKNPNLEFFEIHLEKNYARDEDIDILFGFIKGAFKNISRLEIGWQDAYITENQFTRICNHLLYFKDQLNQFGLTVWKNSKIGDQQVKEICDCLQEFTRLGLVTLGLLECNVTNEVGKILRDFLNALPFLLVLEIGLDDNNLNSALGYIGDGLRTQKLLSYLGISFQESYLRDESLERFTDGLHEMYNLEDIHFFVGKNYLSSDSSIKFFNALHPYSRQLQILDLGFQKNNLSNEGFIESFCEFLKQQQSLIKIELCFDNTKLKGEGIAKILGSINRDQQIELIHLNLQSCSLNSDGFIAITDLLFELKHPDILTLLRLYVPHNVMNLNEEQQAKIGLAFQRFPNLIELDLDFSGCHLFNDFFLSLSIAISSLQNLESYTLILHKCFLSQLRMKCIVNIFLFYFIQFNKLTSTLKIISNLNFFFYKKKCI